MAKLAKAFDMRVLATKRRPELIPSSADTVYGPDYLPHLLPQADYVALTCPLTPQTENLIDALQKGQLAGAGLNCTWEEPLPADSPLSAMENVIITPHSAGETRQYEANVINILLENLARLWRGQSMLYNEVV